MSETDRTLGHHRGEPMSRFLLASLVLLGACVIRPMDDRVFIETGGGSQCWRSSTASGLARLLEGDVQVVLTASEPSSFHFTEVALVSGGVIVEETMSEVEAVMRVTPTDTTTPVVITARLECSSQWGDTGSPDQRFEIVPSALTGEWSITSPQF
jgi:hypothetical protein